MARKWKATPGVGYYWKDRGGYTGYYDGTREIVGYYSHHTNDWWTRVYRMWWRHRTGVDIPQEEMPDWNQTMLPSEGEARTVIEEYALRAERCVAVKEGRAQ
jgi:hypothetical protein